MKNFIAPLILATMITGAASDICGVPLVNTDATKAAFGFVASECGDGDPLCDGETCTVTVEDGYDIDNGKVECVASCSESSYDVVYKTTKDGQTAGWNGMFGEADLSKGGICICISPTGSTGVCSLETPAFWKVTFATEKPVNCALGPAVAAADCTNACGTVTQQIATAASGGGTKCATQGTYACQPGDGACPTNCLLGPAVAAADCTDACGTVTQQIATEASEGGAACATQETYVCQVGDGSCAKTVVSAAYKLSSGVTLEGVTKSIAQSSDFQDAFAIAVADSYGVEAGDVSIDSISESQGRRLANGITIAYSVQYASKVSAEAGHAKMTDDDTKMTASGLQSALKTAYKGSSADLAAMTVAAVEDVEEPTASSATITRPAAAAGAATAALLLVLSANI